MEKLLYFVGGIITEEELDEVGECGGNFGDVGNDE